MRVSQKPNAGFENLITAFMYPEMRVLNVCFENPNKGFGKTQMRVFFLFSNLGPECVF